MGHFKATFDSSGELLQPVQDTGIMGAEVIMLDKDVVQDPDILLALEEYSDAVSLI